MNLVAKEYVASKQDVPGVLILSEMAGAIDELPEALKINPNDVNSLLSAIKRSLLMTVVEQNARLQSMQRRLSRYTVKRWAKDFIRQLDRTKKLQQKEIIKLIKPEVEEKLLQSFVQAKNRLLLLDYDGTLKPFASGPNPNLAMPNQQLLNLLKKLSKRASTQVCIISGRPRQVLEDWFGSLPVTIAAEHGAWIKYKSEWSQQQVSLQEYKKLILPIMEEYAERTPGARIEEKDFAVVWHYRNVAPELAYARNASLKFEIGQLLANTDIGIYSGAKIIEIKPSAIHKGNVAEDLVAMHRADFIFCAGDDYTDEDMFRAVPEDAYSVKVGIGDTDARFQVVSTDDMIKLLEKMSAKIA
jgi:trehalose 6-phosphate synthase/phosphatase